MQTVNDVHNADQGTEPLHRISGSSAVLRHLLAEEAVLEHWAV